MLSVLAIVVALSGLEPAPAAAPEPLAPPPIPVPVSAPEPAPGWYGGAATIVDSLSIGLIVAGLGLNSAPAAELGFVGVASSLIVAPAMHAQHGRPARALDSVALRLAGVVAAVGTVAYVFQREHCGGDDDTCHDLGTALVVAAGEMAVFMAIDDGLLARDAPPPPAGPSLAPAVQISQNRALLTLAGTF